MSAVPPDRPGCRKAPGRRRPLPDPAAIRLCLVPDSAPPYDDDVPAGDPPGLWPGSGDGARPVGGAGDESGKPPAGGGRCRPARDETPRPGAAVPRVPGVDVAVGWQSRFAQVLAEALAGSRPPRQMVPWTTQQAREHIQRLGPRMASVQRPRVRRVVTFRPASDVMEMAVVVGFGPRVRALAVRLERSGMPATAGLGESAGPGGLAGQGLAGQGLAGQGLADREDPGGRWLCTAVEAA